MKLTRIGIIDSVKPYYTLNVYAGDGDIAVDAFTDFVLCYNLNSGPDIPFQTNIDWPTRTCLYRHSITLPANTLVTIGFKKKGVVEVPYYFNADLGSTCPANISFYCGTLDTSGFGFNHIITSNTDVAVTFRVDTGTNLYMPC